MSGIKERIAGLGTKTLVVIAVLIVAVSAATVAYLSNEISATVSVSNPIELILVGHSIDNGATWSTTSPISATAMDTILVKSTIKNKANNEVKTTVLVNCTNIQCDQVTLSHTYQQFGVGPEMSGFVGTCVDGVTWASTPITNIGGDTFPSDYLQSDKLSATFHAGAGGVADGTIQCNIRAFVS